MKDKIKSQLKAKFPTLKEIHLNTIASILSLQTAKEEDIKPMVEKLSNEQITETLKDMSAHLDTEIKTAVANKEKEIKEKFELVEKNKPLEKPLEKPTEKPIEKPVDDLEKKIEAVVSKVLSPIAEKIASFETASIQQKRNERLNTILKDCKDENFTKDLKEYFSNMSFKDDNTFEEFITKQTEKISEVNQRFNENKMQMGSPVFNTRADDGVSQAVKDFLNTKTDEKDPLNGKKL